ncbi:hypothetical protein DYBT9275_02761 [Dyadobacter sp. CECT 9275]|uniref:Uncharacterized protein n=1 Tax=Dyadobacter helix TaxID=2822344 RepID=A0A916JGA6_9BACT|nr:hypothetical protein [Dyadobacter sp. CECT 9275]CAG5001887.1 hypothetical protein DYBT9275_02761 [Dyadobacter sp. CECT 9275]
MDDNERIKKIEEIQLALEASVKKAEDQLFDLLMLNWSEVRNNPSTIRRLWAKFAREHYLPLITQFKTDIETVLVLNEEYFAATGTTEKVKSIAKTVSTYVDDRMGIDATGKIIKEGYLDTLIQDQTAKRKVQQYFYKTRSLKNETSLKLEVKELVKGVENKGGVVDRFFKDNVYDTYQEADRLTQNQYAQELELPAALYVGGLIEGSRAFCKERNRKIFLREEIALFGTPEDTFGGYSDKSKGKFDGKPKDGYDPFTQCGGHGCRHHLSWLTAEFAAVRDKTLQIVDGKLVRIS